MGVPGGLGETPWVPRGSRDMSDVPGDQWGSLRCPIGSTATFDGTTGYLKDPIGSWDNALKGHVLSRGPRGLRGAFRGSEGSIGTSRESHGIIGFV